MALFNGAALRQLRVAAGWTQEELAWKGAVSAATISHLETGRTPNPTVATVEKLADALHVPLTVLLDPNLYTDHLDAVAQYWKKQRANRRRRQRRRWQRWEAERETGSSAKPL